MRSRINKGAEDKGGRGGGEVAGEVLGKGERETHTHDMSKLA